MTRDKITFMQQIKCFFIDWSSSRATSKFIIETVPHGHY